MDNNRRLWIIQQFFYPNYISTKSVDIFTVYCNRKCQILWKSLCG